MPTTVYLIRHGATEGDDVKRYKGSIDVPLSEAGIQQMQEAASFIRSCIETDAAGRANNYLRDIHSSEGKGVDGDSLGLDAVYTSDLQRARKSAEVLGNAFSLDPIAMPELRERHFGIWEGMTFNEIKEKYPAEFSAWANDPLVYSPINGESTVSVRDRSIAAIEKIAEEHSNSNVAVVAHGGVIRVALCHYLGAPLSHIFRIEQDFAAVNIIEFWELYPVVRMMNGGRKSSKSDAAFGGKGGRKGK